MLPDWAQNISALNWSDLFIQCNSTPVSKTIWPCLGWYHDVRLSVKNECAPYPLASNMPICLSFVFVLNQPDLCWSESADHLFPVNCTVFSILIKGWSCQASAGCLPPKNRPTRFGMMQVSSPSSQKAALPTQHRTKEALSAQIQIHKHKYKRQKYLSSVLPACWLANTASHEGGAYQRIWSAVLIQDSHRSQGVKQILTGLGLQSKKKSRSRLDCLQLGTVSDVWQYTNGDCLQIPRLLKSPSRNRTTSCHVEKGLTICNKPIGLLLVGY